MLLHISNNIINLMMKQFINSFSRFAYPVGLVNNYKNGYKKANNIFFFFADLGVYGNISFAVGKNCVFNINT